MIKIKQSKIVALLERSDPSALLRTGRTAKQNNIAKEQELVNANKELITIFEQKIKNKINSVWGENEGGEEC